MSSTEGREGGSMLQGLVVIVHSLIDAMNDLWAQFTCPKRA